MTLAVIWRKRAAISDWISASDFSVGAGWEAFGVGVAVVAESGKAFSWSWAVVVAGVEDDLLLLDFDFEDFGDARILTC